MTTEPNLNDMDFLEVNEARIRFYLKTFGVDLLIATKSLLLMHPSVLTCVTAEEYDDYYHTLEQPFFANRNIMHTGFHVETILRQLILAYNQREIDKTVKEVKNDVEEMHKTIKEVRESLKELKSTLHDIDNDLKNLHHDYNEFNRSMKHLSKDIEDSKNEILHEQKKSFDHVYRHFNRMEDALKDFEKDIKTHFDNAFDDFKKKVDDAFDDFKKHFDEIIDRLRKQIKDAIEDAEDSIKHHTENKIDNLKHSINTHIDDTFREDSNYWEIFKRFLNEEVNRIINHAISRIKGIDELITLTQLGMGLGDIGTSCDNILTSIGGCIESVAAVGAVATAATSAAGAAASYSKQNHYRCGHILSKSENILRKTKTIENCFSPFKPNYYKWLDDNLSKKHGDIEKALDQYQKDHYDDIVKLVSNGCSKASDTISNDVANKIVGESWSKTNGTTSFYPTIVFIMKEFQTDGTDRRAQIKLRYLKNPEDITDEDVGKLIIKAESLRDFSYFYGIKRINFVSKNKLIKTTLYVKEENEAYKVLDSFGKLVELEWDQSDITITDGGRRGSITRRNKPLINIEPFVENYNDVFKVKLYRVVLLINGLRKPIILFQD